MDIHDDERASANTPENVSATKQSPNAASVSGPDESQPAASDPVIMPKPPAVSPVAPPGKNRSPVTAQHSGPAGPTQSARHGRRKVNLPDRATVLATIAKLPARMAAGLLTPQESNALRKVLTGLL